jgi:hypothetical protein
VPDFTTPIAGGASLALLTLMFATFFRLVHLQNERDRENGRRLVALETDKDWCNRRVTLLIVAMQRAGVPVPEQVWEQPPEPVEAGNHHKGRKRR